MDILFTSGFTLLAIICTVGPGFILAGVVGYLIWRLFSQRQKEQDQRKEHLRKIGITAPAHVIYAEITSRTRGSFGHWLNYTYELEVRPEGRAPFKTTLHAAIPVSMEAYRTWRGDDSIGRTIWVTYDPNNPSQMVFEYYDGDRQKVLDYEAVKKMDERDRPIRQNGEDATAVVLETTKMTYTDLMPANGGLARSTSHRLRLEVTPKNGFPFEVEVFAMIADASLHKYEAGRKVKVKIDPRDRNAVALIGSAEFD